MRLIAGYWYLIREEYGGMKRVLDDIECPGCHKIFRPDSSKTKFCGMACAQANRPLHGIVKECICGNVIYLRPSSVRVNNYCSRKCSNDSQRNALTKICTVCSKEYKAYISQEKHRGESKYCSRKCQGESMSARQVGENNPLWRGGVSKENHRIRQSKAFKDWRKAVFERDDYTCQHCGTRGGYLEPDHIKPFAFFKADRFDINNGRTLCQPCHKQTDTYGGKVMKLYGQIQG